MLRKNSFLYLFINYGRNDTLLDIVKKFLKWKSRLLYFYDPIVKYQDTDFDEELLKVLQLATLKAYRILK